MLGSIQVERSSGRLAALLYDGPRNEVRCETQSILWMRLMKIISTAILFLALSILAACGSKNETPAPVQTVVRKPQIAKPADPTARMAHAVVTAKTGAAVDLKYDVLSKPEAGKPLELDLALVLGTVVDSMTVNVAATPGLEIVGNATATFDKLKIGEVTHQKVEVRAEHAEVVYLTVTATLFAVGTSSVRAFAIPLIFSEPATTSEPNSATQPTAPSADGAKTK